MRPAFFAQQPFASRGQSARFLSHGQGVARRHPAVAGAVAAMIAVLRALHPLPLRELVGGKDRFHPLGLGLARGLHLLTLLLHPLHPLQVEVVDLRRLCLVELQGLGHAIGHAARRLLDGGSLFRSGVGASRLCVGVRRHREAKGRCGCKNDSFHRLFVL